MKTIIHNIIDCFHVLSPYRPVFLFTFKLFLHTGEFATTTSSLCDEPSPGMTNDTYTYMS